MMNPSTPMAQTAAAIKADVREIIGLATEAEFREVSLSASSALAARLVVAANLRRARIEKLVVAIKEALAHVAHPAQMTESAWDSIAQKLVSDCITAHFAAAQEPASLLDDRRGLPA